MLQQIVETLNIKHLPFLQTGIKSMFNNNRLKLRANIKATKKPEKIKAENYHKSNASFQVF